MSNRYTFSGHETFACKSLWLKKGYDFIEGGGDFNNPEAVVSLGVGKNMVSSIRFWLRAFGMTMEDQPTELAHRLFANGGWDPYCEDELTLWLLHYQLVSRGEASLYQMTFEGYQRRNREFDKRQLQNYVAVVCKSIGYAVNSGTLGRDINVMLQNYIYPENVGDPEKFSNLLIGLRLLRYVGKEGRVNEKDVEKYGFREVQPEDLPEEVVLYALMDQKKGEKTLSNDALADVALMFCMSMSSLVTVIEQLAKKYRGTIRFTENSGIRNIHFIGESTPMDVLEHYYE